MYQYNLVFGSTRIFLFESWFQFPDEDTCLRHYEKGLDRDLFRFDRTGINQVWSELALWGLIGRICPAELARILCAFGCEMWMTDGRSRQLLQKSFLPVTYFIPVSVSDQFKVRHLYHWPLESNSTEHIPVLLDLDDRLVLGAYYFTLESDVDSQLPKFCGLLEHDLCLPKDSIRISLFRFFENGFKVVAQLETDLVTLAHLDLKSETIHGFSGDNTLFFLGVLSDAA